MQRDSDAPRGTSGSLSAAQQHVVGGMSRRTTEVPRRRELFDSRSFPTESSASTKPPHTATSFECESAAATDNFVHAPGPALSSGSASALSARLKRLSVDDRGRTLYASVASRDISAVSTCLTADCPVLWHNPEAEGKTALHCAAEVGDVGCLRLLIANTADQQALASVDDDRWTALHWATYAAHPYCVAELLAAGAQPTLDKRRRSPVYWACKKGAWRAAEQLLLHSSSNSGAAAGSESSSSQSTSPPLSQSDGGERHRGTIASEPACLLAEAGDSRSVASWSALHLAAVRGDVATVHKVLQCVDTDVNAVGECGLTPLHLAALGAPRSGETTLALLTAGANPKLRDLGGKTAAHRAARCGNVAALSLLTEAAPELVMVPDDDGRQPLHCSCYLGHLDCATLLLESGADVHARELDGSTPLLLAASCGSALLVKHLLDLGARVTDADDDGRLPLYDAAGGGHAGVVSLLLTAGAPILGRSEGGRTALHVACANKHPDIALLLLRSAGCAVPAFGVSRHYQTGNRAGKSGCGEGTARTRERASEGPGRANPGSIEPTSGASAASDERRGPSTRAGRDGRARSTNRVRRRPSGLSSEESPVVPPEASATLSVRGLASPTLPALSNSIASQMLAIADNAGWSPLMEAATAGLTTVVEAMCAAGVDTTVTKSDGKSAIHCAALAGHVGVIEVLIDAGADVHGGDANGDTPLHWVCFRGHAECARVLLDANADIHRINGDGGTALHSAANCGSAETITLLLRRGARVNVAMPDGNTPLHNASYEGHATAVSLLLAHGADVDAPSGEARSPLIEAACSGHAEVVSLLVGHGASVDLQDRGGDSALHWASAGGHAATVQILLDAGAKVQAANVDGGHPLHAAVISSSRECVDLLVAYGADVNAKLRGDDRETVGRQDTCLHVAASNGWVAGVEALIRGGADVNSADIQGRTPLHSAMREAKGACAAILIRHGADFSVRDYAGRTPLQYARGRRPPVESLVYQHQTATRRLRNKSSGRDSFAEFLDNESLSDVRLVASCGRDVPAHKIVLAARCAPFRGMFTGHFAESRAPRVNLPFRFPVLRALLEFLYTGQIASADSDTPGMSLEVAMDVMAAADQYGLEPLKDDCSNVLQRALRLDNLIELYRFAHVQGATMLQLACVDYLLEPSNSAAAMKHAWPGGVPASDRAALGDLINDIIHANLKDGAGCVLGGRPPTSRGDEGGVRPEEAERHSGELEVDRGSAAAEVATAEGVGTDIGEGLSGSDDGDSVPIGSDDDTDSE